MNTSQYLYDPRPGNKGCLTKGSVFDINFVVFVFFVKLPINQSINHEFLEWLKYLKHR